MKASVPIANWSASIAHPTIDVRRAGSHRLESLAGSFMADQFCFVNRAGDVNATDSQYQYWSSDLTSSWEDFGAL
jgi:hypothetical protein